MRLGQGQRAGGAGTRGRPENAPSTAIVDQAEQAVTEDKAEVIVPRVRRHGRT